MTTSASARRSSTARIPADVERPDKVLFGLTSRQALILIVAGLLLYGAYSLLAPLVPPPALVAGGLPIVAAAIFLAIGRREGLPLDSWLLAAWRHRRAAHHLVPVDEEIVPAPAWITTVQGRGDRLALPAPLHLPARGIAPDGSIDLGPDGTTALVGASTVAFGLRTGDERDALVDGFARWLHSLDCPTQIVARARRIDLADIAGRVEDRAPSLPHPALERAARAHAGFLADLASSRELLRREITIAIRDTRGGSRARHHATEAVWALSGCEVTASVHGAQQALATLADCLDPARPLSHPTPAEEDTP